MQATYQGQVIVSTPAGFALKRGSQVYPKTAEGLEALTNFIEEVL